VGSRLLLVGLLSAPLFKIIYLIVQGKLGANPVERLILETGQASLMVLVFLLAIPRLAPWLPWLKGWVSRRRLIGLTVFVYACLHLLLYLADHLGQWVKLPEDLARPFVVTGLVSWLILFILSATSNRLSQKRLKKRWKGLHRAVWLVIPLIAVHLTLKEEGILITAFYWFGPLLGLVVAQGVLLARKNPK